jgi:hypothetical protein
MIVNKEFIFELLLLILKVVIVVFWILDIYLKYVPLEYQYVGIQIDKFWEKRLSFIFDMLVAFLLIYLFNLLHFHQVTKLTKLTLFTFAVMSIISADWSTFIKDSPLIKYL